MANNVKKDQVSVYLPEELIANLRQRAAINNRTLSGEVENMLTKIITLESEADRKALTGASGKQSQS